MMKDNATNISTRRRWPWWLRTPHSRLFSEWIELKTDQERPDRKADGRAA